MKNFYLFQNSELTADEKILRIAGETDRRLPVERVEALHLLSGYTLTSGVVDLASEHDFPIHVYGYYGDYRGTFFPPPVKATGSLLIAQVRSHLDQEQRTATARKILETANRSILSVLETFDLEIDWTLDGTETIQEMMLKEARLRKEYYALLDTVLPPYWSIVKRGRQPPRRPADAILSFTNGLLYARMGGYIHRAGMDPRVGYLHGEARAKNPLALDLAELLKPTLSEGVLLEVAGSGRERSLITHVNDGVYLNEKGRKFVIQTLEELVAKSVQPPNRDRQDTLESWAKSIPRKVHRAIVTEQEPGLPILPCTLSSSTMQALQSDRTSVPS